MLRPHRDKNHKAVMQGLRDRGVTVVETFDPLDLICKFRDYVSWVEVKSEDGNRRYTRKQLKFIAETTFNVVFASTAEDAYKTLCEGSGLTQRQKNGIAAMLLRNEKDLFTPKDVDVAIGIRT